MLESIKKLFSWMVGFRSSRQSQAARRYKIGGVLFEQHKPTVAQAEMVRQVMFEAAADVEEITNLEAAFTVLGAERITKICSILLTRPGVSFNEVIPLSDVYRIDRITDDDAWKVIFHFFVQSPASAKMIGTVLGQKIRMITKDRTPAQENAN